MQCGLIFVLLVAAAAASIAPRELCTKEDDHTIVTGCKPEPTEILSRQSVLVPGRLFLVNTKTVKYPEYGEGTDKIGCIKIIDEVPQGHGGCPIIKSGGTGFNGVTIELISQRSRDMKFIIEIYKAIP